MDPLTGLAVVDGDLHVRRDDLCSGCRRGRSSDGRDGGHRSVPRLAWFLRSGPLRYPGCPRRADLDRGEAQGCSVARVDQVISNRPAAPMPPPTYMVTSAY